MDIISKLCIVLILKMPWICEPDKIVELAKQSNFPILICINMDGEGANDNMAEKIYKDEKFISKLRDKCIVVICSTGKHNKKDGNCYRFDGIKCEDHQKAEIWMRIKILKSPDSDIVAPQHIIVSPNLEILWRKEYDVPKDTILKEVNKAFLKTRGKK